jgi:Outer membrane lipoprotein carrier protein LolA-like
MKRRLLVFGLPVLFAGSGARAQAPFAALKPGQVLRGQFTQQRTLAGFAHPLQSSGEFVLAPGRGLIWRTVQPFAIVTVVTADGLVQDVNGAETTHLAAAQLPFLAKFYRLLSGALAGDWQALDTQFQTTRHGDAQHWELDLVPRGGSDPQTMPFRALTLRGGRFVDDVRISRGNGDADRLVFSDQALGGALSDAERGLLRQAAQ